MRPKCDPGYRKDVDDRATRYRKGRGAVLLLPIHGMGDGGPLHLSVWCTQLHPCGGRRTLPAALDTRAAFPQPSHSRDDHRSAQEHEAPPEKPVEMKTARRIDGLFFFRIRMMVG